MNYAVSVKEVGCDEVDKDDKGDGVTRLIGRLGLHGNGQHWAVQGSFQLF